MLSITSLNSQVTLRERGRRDGGKVTHCTAVTCRNIIGETASRSLPRACVYFLAPLAYPGKRVATYGAITTLSLTTSGDNDNDDNNRERIMRVKRDARESLARSRITLHEMRIRFASRPRMHSYVSSVQNDGTRAPSTAPGFFLFPFSRQSFLFVGEHFIPPVQFALRRAGAIARSTPHFISIT